MPNEPREPCAAWTAYATSKPCQNLCTPLNFEGRIYILEGFPLNAVQVQDRDLGIHDWMRTRSRELRDLSYQ